MKTQSLYLSLVSGAVGIVLGASSVVAVQATTVRTFFHHAAISHTIRDLQEVGRQNKQERGKRVNVTRPTKTLP